MNDDNDFGQVDEEILNDDAADEALEAVANAQCRNPTGRYTVLSCC